MIKIDNRVGSKELVDLFPPGRAQLSNLRYADLTFTGNGPDDCIWSIGIERKRIRDLLNSMVTGRLTGHQVVGLCNCYDAVYLIIEGIWRTNRNGFIEILKRKVWELLYFGQRAFTAQEVFGFLNSLLIFRGIIVWQTRNAQETVSLALALQHWWSYKKFDNHKSFEAPHLPFACLNKNHGLNLVGQIAMGLPDVGVTRAKGIQKQFKTPLEMCLATEEDWMRVPKIGRVSARKFPVLLQEDEKGRRK